MLQIPLARRLALVLAAAFPLFAASCGDDIGSSSAGASAGSDTLRVQTDSLIVSVDSLRYTVRIGYPQVAGASGTVSAAQVAAANGAVRDSVAAFAEAFRPETAPGPDASNFDIAEVEGGTEEAFLGGDLFSAVVWIYTFTGGAHGNTSPVAVNTDLRTGAALRLGDLFQAGTPWADTLSARADRALVAKARGTDDPVSVDEARATLEPEGYAPAAMPAVRFTLGADSLALHFEPYEVAYFAFGSTRVPVAYADLAAMLRPDGPAARLAARAARR